MKTTEKITQQYRPGDVVVLRGLRTNSKQANSALIGPRVGKIAMLLANGRVLVRLHLGFRYLRSTYYCRKPRVCLLENVARLATERERVFGADVVIASVAA